MTGTGSIPSWLAAIEPARPAADPTAAKPASDDPAAKANGIVDADGALDRSAPGASSATYRAADEVAGKGSDAAGMKHKRSVIKEFGLATAQRWAKGGGTTNKRLDLKKAEAQAHQVKENRTTTVMKSGGLLSRNNSASGGGGQNSSGKSQGNGRTNSTGNNSGGAGRGGTGGGRGGAGNGSTGGGGGKQQAGGGMDTGSAKGGGNGAAGGSGSNGSNGSSGGGKNNGSRSSGNGKNHGTSGTGSGSKNSGSSDSGKRSKNNGSGSSGGGGKTGGSGKDGASGKQGAAGKDGKAGSSGSSGGGAGKNGAADSKAGKGSKSDKAGHGQDGVDRRTPLEKSRDIGHGDGGAVRNVIDHVKAYKDGAVDGYRDKKAENAKDHARLDKARDDQRAKQAGTDGQPKEASAAKPVDKAKPAPTTATTGDGRTVVITTNEGDDGVSTDVKPLMVKEIDANTLTLGTEGARGSVSRKELRNFKQYERKLEAKETHLIKIAEACKQLEKAAEKEAQDCQKLMEQAKSVKGGEKVAQKLSKLVEAAKNQATEAAALHKQAKRAAEMCKVVRTNIDTRYAPLYKAVVDSDETKPAELRFYNDKGSYATAA
ncbi:hypothetical protein AB0I82_35335 [Streptomyces sp. NPDC050315]|uniref:hypothetical protein n=1 Tax=Streptomyces sp. NPDC050315 TaxID=3155039 RepID=UPI00342503BB